MPNKFEITPCIDQNYGLDMKNGLDMNVFTIINIQNCIYM